MTCHDCGRHAQTHLGDRVLCLHHTAMRLVAIAFCILTTWTAIGAVAWSLS